MARVGIPSRRRASSRGNIPWRSNRESQSDTWGARMYWGWKARVAIIVAVVLGTPLIASLASEASASALHPTGTVGMPFKGQWASDVKVNPPFTSDPSYPAVDPANNGGDWATNLWAPEGTPIKLQVTSTDGTVTFQWVSSDASCDGVSSKMDVLVNNTKVGWIYFAHFLG